VTRHFERELSRLKRQLFYLASLVEKRLAESVEALERRDARAATEVIERDTEIDRLEVDLEEECLKILALHQPVAGDLRFVVAVLKINNDLERIGDLAVNIAERALVLASEPPVRVALDFDLMARKSRAMLRESLDALVRLDAEKARAVLAADDEVDALNREMYEEIRDAIREDTSRIEVLIHLLLTSRHLERVADHATNIAEDVLYMVEGEIARHQAEDFRRGDSG
jgi:phosphate transport system protein